MLNLVNYDGFDRLNRSTRRPGYKRLTCPDKIDNLGSYVSKIAICVNGGRHGRDDRDESLEFY